MADPWFHLARTRVFACPPGMPRHEHMRYLDNEITTLDAILANAKEIRNMQTLIVSFPEEILVEILSYVRDDPPRSVAHGRWPYMMVHSSLWNMRRRRTCWQCGDYRLWTSVAGVCRRFRAIASSGLLNAKVWDRTLPPALLRRSLACSAPIPVELDLSSRALGSGSDAMSVLKYIKLNRDRVHSLNLRGADGRDLLALHFLQRLNHFVNLKRLSLTHHRSDAGEAQPFVVPLNSLGDPLRGWHPPPSITHLNLELLPFPWASTIYNDLVELRLSGISASNNNAPTLTVINDLFQRLTRLEALTFDRVDVDISPIDLDVDEMDMFEEEREDEIYVTEKTLAFLDEQWQSGQFIPPTSLRTWTVVSNSFSIVPFLMRPSPSITYILTSLSPPHESDSLLKRFLSIHFPPSPTNNHGSVLAPVASIEFVVEDGPTSLHARASYSRQTNTDAAPDVVLHFYTEEAFTPYECLIDLLDEYDRNDPQRWLAKPSYNHVTELTLNCCVEYPGRDWRRYFRRLRSLRTLRLTENMLPTVLLGLRLRDDSEIALHPAYIRGRRYHPILVPDDDGSLPLDIVKSDQQDAYEQPAGEVEDTDDVAISSDDIMDEADIPIEAYMSDGDLYDGDDHLEDVEAATGIDTLHVKPSEQYGYTSPNYTVHLLLEWLALRKAKGAPLRTLHVSSRLATQMEECYSDEEGVGGWTSLLALSP
ncbi:hypothetical protein PENSPDRAFT_656071 [Peniophora sp. CONT]|nr:hypothetical protein PENSPDRAFT_656071 [Peniophora sp. CONT]